MGIVIYKNQANWSLRARAVPKGGIHRSLHLWIVPFGWHRPRVLCRPFGSDVRRGKRGPLHPVNQSKRRFTDEFVDKRAATI